MQKSILVGASAIALGLVASSSALAGGITKVSMADNKALLQPKLVVSSAGQVNDPQFKVGASAYSGVGGLIMNTDSLDAAGFITVCTGTFIAADVVVTAAHCVDDSDLNRIRFRTGAGNGLAGTTFDAEYEAFSYWVHPGFDFPSNDIAFIKLKKSASNGEEIYGVYTENDELGQIHTKVGFGTTGEGTAGTRGITPATDDFDKRAGNNIYEGLGSDIFSDVGDGVLLFDFDSGLDENDVFGTVDRAFCGGLELCFAHDTGVVIDGVRTEVNSSPGDSGGPTFIAGLLAGITSFGITGGVFDGGCGPGFIDPDSNAPGVDVGVTPVSSACTNSSFGELSGDTRVSYYLDEINAMLRGDLRMIWLPEPGMLGLFGLGVVGALAARRRRKTA
ncbi:MAG: trypsin-like serine protease [Pseudomonadota bacterium]|nr:trypsin-like serine protease [Pseudomonadota bacterium]